MGDSASRRRLYDYIASDETPDSIRRAAGLALGRWLLQQGKCNDAIAPLETSFALTDRLDVPTASLLADALSRTGRHAEALARLAPLTYRQDADSSTLIRIGCLRSRIEDDPHVGSGPLLENLNRIYVRNGFAMLYREEVAQPLTLENICAEAPLHEPADAEPRVSVVIPMDTTADLTAALRGLARQSWGNLEVLVVTPRSQVEHIRRSVDKVSVRPSQVLTEGWGDEDGWREAVLQSATGDFVLLHEPTEWSHPQRIELQATALITDRELSAASASSCWFDEEFLPFVGDWPSTEVVTRRQPPMVRRSAWDKEPDFASIRPTAWLEREVPMSLLQTSSHPAESRWWPGSLEDE